VVRYAAERRLARKGQADYWDYATRLELAVLANDDNGVADAIGDAVANAREKWSWKRRPAIFASSRSAGGERNRASGVDPVLAELTKRIGTFGG